VHFDENKSQNFLVFINLDHSINLLRSQTFSLTSCTSDKYGCDNKPCLVIQMKT
jgi:hypothetical protein